MPSTEYPLDVYKEYLLELKNTISALQSDGPVMVTGDFNAHLGDMGVPVVWGIPILRVDCSLNR